MRRTGTLAALLLLLTGCASALGGEQLDVPAMERDIESGYHEQTGTRVEVTCPESAEWDTGGDFRCQLRDTDNNTALVTVYMDTDDEWFWEVS